MGEGGPGLAEARRAWCEEERKKLIQNTGDHWVPPDKTDWALWGEENGYFRRSPGGPGGRMVLILPAPKRP